uniref:Putative secreted protein n=1 Tax=Anopheles darlingi TaxID=43151 RepID=A0A2M4DB84_ANODA
MPRSGQAFCTPKELLVLLLLLLCGLCQCDVMDPVSGGCTGCSSAAAGSPSILWSCSRFSRLRNSLIR